MNKVEEEAKLDKLCRLAEQMGMLSREIEKMKTLHKQLVAEIVRELNKR
jgi:hypothetical protein